MTNEYAPVIAKPMYQHEASPTESENRTRDRLNQRGLDPSHPENVVRVLVKSSEKNPCDAGLLHDCALFVPEVGVVAVDMGLVFERYNHNEGSGKPILLNTS